MVGVTLSLAVKARHWLGLLSAAILLAVAWQIMPAILRAPSSTVGACGWYMQGTKSVITPDGNAQLWLQNFYDGSHNHYYQAQVQNRQSASITTTMHIRVWVCGSFKEDLSWDNTVVGFAVVSHVSHTWNYSGLCGPQADNYDTYIRTPTVYHSPTTSLSF